MHYQRHVADRHEADRRKAAHGIVGHGARQCCVLHDGARGHQQRIAVGRRLRHGFCPDISAGAGASGNIGTETVSKSPADGYTLLMTASTIVQNAALSRSVPYDPVRGFTPIGLVAIGNMALVVHSSVPAKSVAEFVALAKAHPGRLNYASPGSGTPHHLAMELFKLNFGVDVTHVPYKGTAGAVTDLLGGQVQAMFLPVHVALPRSEERRVGKEG